MIKEMDLSRAVYSRYLKIAAMRALDAGTTTGEIAREYQVSSICWNVCPENGASREIWHSQGSVAGSLFAGRR
jgi:hypothetical protein